MASGYTGTIAVIDLSSGGIEKLKEGDDFYRLYMGGSAFGSYFLLKETGQDTGPLSPENVITIAPGVTTGAAVSGVSRCCVTALSPLTGMAGDGQAGGDIGPMIKRAGYDAIVIKGAAQKPCYILADGDSIEIRDAGKLWGRTVSDAHRAISAELGDKNLSVMQCGPAGEEGVVFANLMVDRNDAVGRCGLGAVFGSKNLRAVVVRGTGTVEFADPAGLRDLAKAGAKALAGSGFPETLKKHGTPGVVKFQAEAGNFATRNFSAGSHKEYLRLYGADYEPDIGAGGTTCFGCAIGCRKRVKSEDNGLSDYLGGPEFETLGLLGSNLDIADAAAVARANELCNNYGLDTITMGGVAGYICECVERALIPAERLDGIPVAFGNPEGLLRLIEAVATRKGVGDVIAGGFASMIEAFGEETAPFAVQVKGAGLPVHMPQVKPSLALMYAVCPIGPDHMSSEHDWLLASNSEAGKGLGIFGQEDTGSTGLAKVRMTAYSQIYYSLMDALSLCMFCWGPGSIFTYQNLEDLILFTTGWKATFWELMKAGERRINMMRHINARRGFTREHDRLPPRLFEPLLDGPSKGKRVDPDVLETMKDQYYALMGWNPVTGNPTSGKLMELGLDWVPGQ